ncbi:MAG: glycosyltransferase family 4 protein [Patescibacteria group bacterium]
MRVVFVCPFSLERLTGTPIRTKTTIAAAAGLGHEVFVVAREGKDVAGVRVRATGLVGMFSFTRAALSALKSFGPDIVHGFTTASVPSMLIYKWFVNRRAKVVFEMHGLAWLEQKHASSFFKRLLFLKMDYLGLWFSNAVIAMSNTEKTFLSKRASGRRIHVLWGPVDFLPEYVEPPPRPFSAVGYVGNSERWQGLEHVIEAAELLQDRGDIRFELAGFNFEDEQRFPRLNNVHYVGRVERKDVLAFLHACNVLISSRLSEPVSDMQFPQKLSEYLAAGRPVIVSSASDQALVVTEGRCGSVLSSVDGHAIAEAITHFAGLSRDEKAQLGKNAREFCKKNLHITAFSTKLKAVYTSVYQ